MTLDEAIQHCEEVADEKEEDAIIYHNCATYKQNLYEKGLAENTEKECRACAEEHRQLAEWLKELKAYKENICDDAISRQAVIDILDDMVKNYVNENDFDKAQGIAWVKVQRLPSVTPQRRTGRWIEVIDETDSLGNKTWHHECSICGSDKSGWGTYKHCPHCGAKMEVEE